MDAQQSLDEAGRLMEAGRAAQAAAVLEGALAQAPKEWTLWQLLGNAYDELGRHEDALGAYERALDCPDVWEAHVRLNRAVVLERIDRHAEGLSDAEQALADADREPFEAEAVNVAVTCLIALERPDDAVEMARTMLERCPLDAEPARHAALHAELAWAVYVAHDDRDAALAELRQASRMDPSLSRITELLHEMGAQRPASWMPPPPDEHDGS
jgi:tetratricopeptide (TPR) repeat protein